MDTGGGATHNEQDYGYDAVGNMWATSNLGSKLPASPDTPASAGAYRSGNHLNGVNYDAAGSQTTDPAMCPTTSCIQYDAENRQVVFGTNYYQYDGEGRRVVSATTSGTTIYVYDAEGKGAAEYASSLPTPVCSTCFLTTDHLGSTRLVTDQNANVIARHDYMPFGQELINGYAGRSAQYGASDLVSQKFTGKERDSESGLDYFGARYYGSALGRFTSADPVWVKADRLVDPQRLNLYAYGRNNPLRFTDPTGMDVTIGSCPSNRTVSECFAAVQNGLRKEDRSHTHLVTGDGKNGFKKGQYGITVDSDYKSSSGNFQALQKIANDHSAVAQLDFVNSGFQIQGRIGIASSSGVQLQDIQKASGGTAVMGQGLEGFTLDQLWETPEKDVSYSYDSTTHVLLDADESTKQLVETVAHEVRHVLLGDFGRTGALGLHDAPGVNRATKQAADEADKNSGNQ